MQANETAALMSFLEHASQRFIELSSIFPKNPDDHAQYHLVGLNMTTNKLAEAIVTLCKSDHFVAVSPVLRAMLEAQVDILNLIKVPGYYYQLRRDYLNRLIKIINNPLPGDASMQIAKHRGISVDIWLSKLTEEQSKLEEMGYKTLKINEKFDLAGMKHDYLGIYAQLCSETHNRVDAVSRRLIADEFGSGYAMLGVDDPFSSHKIELIVAAETLCRSNGLLHEELQTTDLEVCSELLQALRLIWTPRSS